ncbi:unnamed protein product [Xylocopa violacea]|uniref:Neurotransmitter-gated ion-channel ligand-binding domain-containing protein n=1 Tax=Xylocopa violacea TaxID=135666 RepID=A0ABP1NF32_XYLVO
MKNFFRFLVVLVNVLLNKHGICIFTCKDITSNSQTQILKNYLFCNYDTQVRPTENYKNATTVEWSSNIRHIEVDELANTAEMHVWMKMVWTDPHLTWKPSDHGGIDLLHVMSYELWVPDVTLHSVTNMDVDVEMPMVQCWLKYTGVVLCVPSTTYTTYCDSDHTWWPYDTMNCSLHIASWSYTNDEIDLRLGLIDLFSDLGNDVNVEWEVMDTSHSERLIESKFGSNFTSKLLSYNFFLKRRASMYTTSYVTLAIVLMTATLLVLWLEPKSTERMVIANLNFVLHLISLHDLHWKVPYSGARPPELLLLYENSLALATFSLMLTSILRYLQELNRDAPEWISSSTVLILKSRIGQIFLMSILDPKVSARIELNADDNTNLVSLDNRVSTWTYVSILVGWFAFLIVSFVYIIMLIVYLPTSRSESHFTVKP